MLLSQACVVYLFWVYFCWPVLTSNIFHCGIPIEMAKQSIKWGLDFYHITALCTVWFLNFHPENTFTDVLRTDWFSLKFFISVSVIKLAMFKILYGHFYFYLFTYSKVSIKHDLRPILSCRTRNSATQKTSAPATAHNLLFWWSQLATATLKEIYSTSY